jgi:thioredoxin-like negative regulator of GroEL
MSHVPRPVEGWFPSNPPVHQGAFAEVLQAHPIVVVQFWARWNGYDPVTDERLRPLRTEFAAQVHFCACDVDVRENWELCRAAGVLNVPWIAVFVEGALRASSLRYSKPEELRQFLALAILAREAPASAKGSAE